MRKEGVRIEMETQVEVNIKALSDMGTCHKFFRKEVLSQIELKEKRFGIELEITAKIAKTKGIRVYRGAGITYEEGMKIGWKDGF